MPDNHSHVRIDEGIARGPRTPHTLTPRPAYQRRNGSLAKADAAAVSQRYLRDENTAVIAESLAVHRSTVNQWLLRTCEDEWKGAQVARAITALEQAKDDLAIASDALALARAREQMRCAQWELERLFARLYGVKGDAAPAAPPILVINVALTPHAAVLQPPAEPVLIEVKT